MASEDSNMYEEDEDDEEESTTHLQILDLTNGQGGSCSTPRDNNHNTSLLLEIGGAHAGNATPPTPPLPPPPPAVAASKKKKGRSTHKQTKSKMSTTPGTSTSTVFDPSTPGKVVEHGQELTGRWTRQEHEAFLQALQHYGKEWKKVAAKVKTRTVVQTRTHAQKYFQKLQKSTGDTSNMMAMMTGESGEDSSSSPEPSPVMRPRRPPPPTTTTTPILQTPPPPAARPRIRAPPLSSTTHTRHKFPEPSPAASGKRKLAELAAAQMLAGVAAAARASTPPPLATSPAVRPGAATLQSLQIVNPDQWEGNKSAESKQDDPNAPTTPWSGQLQALVDEQKERKKQRRDEDSEPKPKKEEDEDSSPAMFAPMGIPLMPLDPSLSSSTAKPQVKPSILHPSTGFGRSRLHKAVCEQDVAALQISISLMPPSAVQATDALGFAPLHAAAASGNPHVVRALVSAGASVSQQDKQGNTCLHWAVRQGKSAEVTTLLLQAGASRDATNKEGETPLHWAMRAACLEMITILLENGARTDIGNRKFRRPLDVAAMGFSDEKSPAAASSAAQVRAHFFKACKNARTLVLNHPECLLHIPKSEADWECPHRVTTIMERVQQSCHAHEVVVSQDFDRAKVDLLSRVHSTEYLAFVNELSTDLERQMGARPPSASDTGSGDDTGSMTPPPVVPFTPMVQRSMIKVAESQLKLGQHSDTSFSAGSLKAARRAAGAVQHAVDCVLIGRNRNAFCIVRPPGHHAGVNGLLDGGESCGFCIFNNVAAGALHALSEERLLCEKCAIVDIDVHHGNGTEEIVRRYHDPSKLFFFSIHLYDNDPPKPPRKNNKDGGPAPSSSSSAAFHYKFYPGTGDADDVPMNIVNVPIRPLWKDPAAARSASSSSSHNTRQKSRRKLDPGGDESSGGGTPRTNSASDAEQESQSRTLPTYSSSTPATSGRTAYRQAILQRLLPALRAFDPDLILISAGFDASRGDVGNAKHEVNKERMGLDLWPEDYAWTTRQIVQVADLCCPGRVVSVLEGGYGQTPTSSSSTTTGGGLDRSILGEAALRHLHALVDPYNVEQRYSSSPL